MQKHAMTRRIAPASLPDFTPVPRRYRADGWTPERQHAFIAALADSGSVKRAAAQVGMSADSAYQLRRQKGADGFNDAWRAALGHGIARLEDVAMERALYGVGMPVYSYGKLVGTRRAYNDALLMFLLRSRAAGRFIPQGVDPVEYAAFKEHQQKGGPGSEDALVRMHRVLAEIRRLRAKEEADPRGPRTIQGDERLAFERWYAQGQEVAGGDEAAKGGPRIGEL